LDSLEPFTRGSGVGGTTLVGRNNSSVHLNQSEWTTFVDAIDTKPSIETQPETGSEFRPPSWIKPGLKAIFVGGEPTFAPIFTTSPLYRRLLPFLIDNAHSIVAVEATADGRLNVVGQAWGSGNQACQFDSRELIFNPVTGFYDVPAAAEGGARSVIRFTAYSAEIADDDGCGFHAWFGPMHRLSVDDENYQRFIDFWG